MAKNNNLTDFLTDVADAIRAKKGKTDHINPQDFSAEIASIETGVNPDNPVVTFIDYDGSVLKVENVKSGQSATPPEVPSHEHLTFNEWVGDYTNVTEDRAVGAHYVSADGHTWLHHRSGDYVQLAFTCPNEVIIDWGDGSSDITESGGVFVHHYTDGGQHWICIMGDTDIVFNSETNKQVNIDSIILGNNVNTVGDNAFKECRTIISIVLSDSIDSIGAYAFNGCYSLYSIILPNNVTSIGQYAFQKCYNLCKIALPDNVTIIDKYAFESCYYLSKIVLPDSVKTIGQYAFRNCKSIRSIKLPDNINLENYAFFGCISLSSIIIPAGATIGNYVFQSCSTLVSAIFPDTPISIGTYIFMDCI